MNGMNTEKIKKEVRASIRRNLPKVRRIAEGRWEERGWHIENPMRLRRCVRPHSIRDS